MAYLDSLNSYLDALDYKGTAPQWSSFEVSGIDDFLPVPGTYVWWIDWRPVNVGHSTQVGGIAFRYKSKKPQASDVSKMRMVPSLTAMSVAATGCKGLASLWESTIQTDLIDRSRFPDSLTHGDSYTEKLWGSFCEGELSGSGGLAYARQFLRAAGLMEKSLGRWRLTELGSRVKRNNDKHCFFALVQDQMTKPQHPKLYGAE